MEIVFLFSSCSESCFAREEGILWFFVIPFECGFNGIVCISLLEYKDLIF